MLQVSYSFFNQIGPSKSFTPLTCPANWLDTFFLVGVAARMAIGMGLHTSSSYLNLPVDVVEYRKRIFFSLYMMDRCVPQIPSSHSLTTIRVVSMALGRPFAMHDDDIDIQVLFPALTNKQANKTTALQRHRRRQPHSHRLSSNTRPTPPF